jgi:hypothetical protein
VPRLSERSGGEETGVIAPAASLLYGDSNDEREKPRTQRPHAFRVSDSAVRGRGIGGSVRARTPAGETRGRTGRGGIAGRVVRSEHLTACAGVSPGNLRRFLCCGVSYRPGGFRRVTARPACPPGSVYVRQGWRRYFEGQSAPSRCRSLPVALCPPSRHTTRAAGRRATTGDDRQGPNRLTGIAQPRHLPPPMPSGSHATIVWPSGCRRGWQEKGTSLPGRTPSCSIRRGGPEQT